MYLYNQVPLHNFAAPNIYGLHYITEAQEALYLSAVCSSLWSKASQFKWMK